LAFTQQTDGANTCEERPQNGSYSKQRSYDFPYHNPSLLVNLHYLRVVESFWTLEIGLSLFDPANRTRQRSVLQRPMLSTTNLFVKER